jgi:hypothetical protein
LRLKCHKCGKKYNILVNAGLRYNGEFENIEQQFYEQKKHIGELEEKIKDFKNLEFDKKDLESKTKLIQIQAPFVADSKNMAVRVLTQLQTELVINPQVNTSKIIDDLLKDLQGEK